MYRARARALPLVSRLTDLASLTRELALNGLDEDERLQLVELLARVRDNLLREIGAPRMQRAAWTLKSPLAAKPSAGPVTRWRMCISRCQVPQIPGQRNRI